MEIPFTTFVQDIIGIFFFLEFLYDFLLLLLCVFLRYAISDNHSNFEGHPSANFLEIISAIHLKILSTSLLGNFFSNTIRNYFWCFFENKFGIISVFNFFHISLFFWRISSKTSITISLRVHLTFRFVVSSVFFISPVIFFCFFFFISFANFSGFLRVIFWNLEIYWEFLRQVL